jgi:hypothetical protein
MPSKTGPDIEQSMHSHFAGTIVVSDALSACRLCCLQLAVRILLCTSLTGVVIPAELSQLLSLACQHKTAFFMIGSIVSQYLVQARGIISLPILLASFR